MTTLKHIQKNITIASKVLFNLTNGRILEGRLTKLEKNHYTLIQTNGLSARKKYKNIDEFETIEHSNLSGTEWEGFQKTIMIGTLCKINLENREIAGVLNSISENEIYIESHPPIHKNEFLSAEWEQINNLTDFNKPNPSTYTAITLPEDKPTNPIDLSDNQKISPTITNDDASFYENKEASISIQKDYIIKQTIFNEKLKFVQLQPIEPDFVVDLDDISIIDINFQATIHKIQQKYDYALKVNELGSRFGRIRDIINDLRRLTKIHNNVWELHSHLGFFYGLEREYTKSYEAYVNALDNAVTANSDFLYINAIRYSIQDNKIQRAVYFLEKYYLHPLSSLIENEIWIVTIRAILKIKYFRFFSKLLEKVTIKKELEVIFFSLIFLIGKLRGKEAAEHFLYLGDNSDLRKANEILIKELEPFSEENYSKFLIKTKQEIIKKQEKVDNKILTGSIYKFDKTFGFIKTDTNSDVFFHNTAIEDEYLKQKLTNIYAGQILDYPVQFSMGKGRDKGKLAAIKVKLHKTPQQMIEVAKHYADQGIYNSAISEIKKIINDKQIGEEANKLYEQWKRKATLKALPTGSNPFAKAFRAEVADKDDIKAEKYYLEALKIEDKLNESLFNLIKIYQKTNRYEEAKKIIELHEKKVTKKKELLNTKLQLYRNTEEYENQLIILNQKLKSAPKNKKSSIYWQIATTYIKFENYEEAEKILVTFRSISPNNPVAERTYAYVLSRQKKNNEALEVLIGLLENNIDSEAQKLFDLINDAVRNNSELAKSDEFETRITTISLSTEVINDFSKFYLDRVQIDKVIPASRVDLKGKYINDTGSIYFRDSERVKKNIFNYTRSRPEGRSENLMILARLYYDTEAEASILCQYLTMGQMSEGDEALEKQRSMDAIRSWYVEAVANYDKIIDLKYRGKEEKLDLSYSIVKYINSTLNDPGAVSTGKIEKFQELSRLVNGAIEKVFTKHPNKIELFRLLSYLVFNSQVAEKMVLEHLFSNYAWKAGFLEYCKEIGFAEIVESVQSKSDWNNLWGTLKRKYLDNQRKFAEKWTWMEKANTDGFEINSFWLQQVIIILEELMDSNFFYFELDTDRARKISNIINQTKEVFEAHNIRFETLNSNYRDLENECETNLKDILLSPTRLSIEKYYPFLASVLKILKLKKEKLLEDSMPQLSLRLPEGIDTSPAKDGYIEVQIVVKNEPLKSPAESLQLLVSESDEEEEFEKAGNVISFLVGGEQRIIKAKLPLNKEIEAFSFNTTCSYKTINGEELKTEPRRFQIILKNEEDFIEIEDPYYIGGPIAEPDMFYGRDDLVDEITKAFESKNRKQGIGYAIWGQKRTGKSSVLFHLAEELRKNSNNLVVDIGNIGGFLNEKDLDGMYPQFLWRILRELRNTIEDYENENFSLEALGIEFPKNMNDYSNNYNHLGTFEDILSEFHRKKKRYHDWKEKQVIILIDEFTYLYKFIKKGVISNELMTNLKAFLQQNLFHVVLVGQDFMMKFLNDYKNQFAAMEFKKLSYLDKESAFKLMDEPIKIGGKNGQSRYKENALQRIFELTAGSPFYTQIICKRLVLHMNDNNAPFTTEAYVDDVVEILLKSLDEKLLKEKFDNLYNSEDSSEDAVSQEDAIKVLYEIAINSKNSSCRKNAIKCDTNTNINEIISNLEERDVIAKDKQISDAYYIRVGLFKEWLLVNKPN